MAVFLAACAFAQLAPVYSDFGIAGQTCCAVLDGSGGRWLAGFYDNNSASYGTTQTLVLHTTASGATIGSWTSSTARVNALALDATGNVIVVGRTTLPADLPIVGQQFLAADANDAAFVARIRTDGTLLSAMLLSGGPQVQTGAFNSADAVTRGPDNSIYVTGAAIGTAFPTTPGAFQAAKDGNYAFVMKLTPDASAITWATLLGGTQLRCFSGPAGCADLVPTSDASAIAVDANGFVTVAGDTLTSDFPVTDQSAGDMFVTRLKPAGTALAWSTLVQDAFLTTMSIDAGGNAVVGASNLGDSHVFVAKLNVSTGAVMYSTLLGSDKDQTRLSSLAVEHNGDVVVDGFTFDPSFPVTAGAPASGLDFVIRLDSSGGLIASFRAPSGSADAQILPGPGADVTVLGYRGSVLQLPSIPPTRPVLLGVVNSGGSQVSPQVSPGGFVSFYGQGLGPVTPAGAVLNGSALATKIGGVRVLFDGVPAPLLYASSTQINAIVPFEVAGHSSTVVRIEGPDGDVPAVTLFVVPATPTIFALTHANGTLVSQTDPAVDGEILVMYAGGAGLFSPPLQTGAVVNSAPWPKPLLPVTVGGSIIYAGSAPGLVAGALQVNFRFSGNNPAALQIGDTLFP